MFPDGLVAVEKRFDDEISYFNPHEYGAHKAEDLQPFIVSLKENSTKNGALGDSDEKRIGEVVEALQDGENRFVIKDKMTGDQSVYHISQFWMRGISDVKEEAKKIANLLKVSKKGFLPAKLPSDMERIMYSQVTGRPEKEDPEQRLQNLKDMIEGPKHIYNVALRRGPLPYGPSEENFAGGKRSGSGRKSRGKLGNQMARRGTRRSSRGIFSRLYSPIGHLLSAGKESVGAVTNTAKGVVGQGVHGLDKIGRSVTKHANMAVKDVFTRRGGKRRGSRKSRKSRRTTRRRR